MEKLSFPQTVLAGLAGPLLAILHFTVEHGFLGFSISGWLKLAPVVFTLAVWLMRWGIGWVLLGLFLIVAVRLIYWWAGRKGYIHFITFASERPAANIDPLADNQRLKIRATGTFSVGSREGRIRQAYLLQRPAEYWRVPLGDHTVMVERERGSFMYQFIQAAALQKVEAGLLVYGRQPQQALAVTFLSSWEPDMEDVSFDQFNMNLAQAPAKLRRRMHLTFSSEADCRRVWHNLLRDTTQSGEQPV